MIQLGDVECDGMAELLADCFFPLCLEFGLACIHGCGNGTVNDDVDAVELAVGKAGAAAGTAVGSSAATAAACQKTDCHDRAKNKGY